MYQYFNRLNPKPDLCIFWGSLYLYESTVQQLCCDFATTNTKDQHVIAYNSSNFAYKGCVDIKESWKRILAIHIFQCRGIAGNPQFIVATYMGCSESSEYSVKDKFRDTEIVFKFCSTLVIKHNCPVYIAGKLYVDLPTFNRYGFEVPVFAPNMVYKGYKCPNHFAYKNPTSDGAAISISDVVAEMITLNPARACQEMSILVKISS